MEAFPGKGLGDLEKMAEKAAGAAGGELQDLMKNASSLTAPGAAPAGGEVSEEEKKTISYIFGLLYKFIAVVISVLVALAVLISIFDLVVFIWDEIEQLSKKDQLNKETLDIYVMKYLNTNQTDDEPYNVFLGQSIIGSIISLVGAAIMILGIHVAVVLGMNTYKKLQGGPNSKESTEPLTFPIKYLVAIFLAGGGAALINSMYKRHFVDGAQGAMKTLRTNLREIRTYIYDNLIPNQDFLKKITSGDLAGAINIIVRLSNIPNPAINGVVQDDLDVQKALFTYNFYTFFEGNIPSSDNATYEWQKMFTADAIKNRSVDPNMFFYYNQPTYIPNLYPNLRERIRQAGGFRVRPNEASDPQGEVNTAREQRMSRGLSLKMQNINKRMSKLSNIPQGKESLRNYMITFSAYITIFMAIIVMIFWAELGPALTKAWNFMKSFSAKKREEAEKGQGEDGDDGKGAGKGVQNGEGAPRGAAGAVKSPEEEGMKGMKGIEASVKQMQAKLTKNGLGAADLSASAPAAAEVLALSEPLK